MIILVMFVIKIEMMVVIILLVFIDLLILTFMGQCQFRFFVIIQLLIASDFDEIIMIVQALTLRVMMILIYFEVMLFIQLLKMMVTHEFVQIVLPLIRVVMIALAIMYVVMILMKFMLMIMICFMVIYFTVILVIVQFNSFILFAD